MKENNCLLATTVPKVLRFITVRRHLSCRRIHYFTHQDMMQIKTGLGNVRQKQAFVCTNCKQIIRIISGNHSKNIVRWMEATVQRQPNSHSSLNWAQIRRRKEMKMIAHANMSRYSRISRSQTNLYFKSEREVERVNERKISLRHGNKPMNLASTNVEMNLKCEMKSYLREEVLWRKARRKYRQIKWMWNFKTNCNNFRGAKY